MQAIIDEGYRAQAQGKALVSDNPYPEDSSEHWLWRKGWLEAWKESN